MVTPCSVLRLDDQATLKLYAPFFSDLKTNQIRAHVSASVVGPRYRQVYGIRPAECADHAYLSNIAMGMR
jgi:hypothetical protein